MISSGEHRIATTEMELFDHQPIESFEQYFMQCWRADMRKYYWKRTCRLKLQKWKMEMGLRLKSDLLEHFRTIKKFSKHVESLVGASPELIPAPLSCQAQGLWPFLGNSLDIDRRSPMPFLTNERCDIISYHVRAGDESDFQKYRHYLDPVGQMLFFPRRYYDLERPESINLPGWYSGIQVVYGLVGGRFCGNLWTLPPPFPFVTLRELEVSNAIQFPCPYFDVESDSDSDDKSWRRLPLPRLDPWKHLRFGFRPLAPHWLQNISMFEAILRHTPWFRGVKSFEQLRFEKNGLKDEFYDVYCKNLEMFEGLESPHDLPSEEELVMRSALEYPFGTDERERISIRSRMATYDGVEETPSPLNLRGGGSDRRPHKRRALEPTDGNGDPRAAPVFTSSHLRIPSNSKESAQGLRAEPSGRIIDTTMQSSKSFLLGSFDNPIDLTRGDSDIDDDRGAQGPKPQNLLQQESVSDIQRIFNHPSPIALPIFNAKIDLVCAWLAKLEKPKEPILFLPHLSSKVEAQELNLQLHTGFSNANTLHSSPLGHQNQFLDDSINIMISSQPYNQALSLKGDNRRDSQRSEDFSVEEVLDMIIEHQFRFTRTGLTLNVSFNIKDFPITIPLPESSTAMFQPEDTGLDNSDLEAALERAVRDIKRETFLERTIRSTPPDIIDGVQAELRRRLTELGYTNEAQRNMKAAIRFKVYMNSYMDPFVAEPTKPQEDFNVILFEHGDLTNWDWVSIFAFRWKQNFWQLENFLKEHLSSACGKLGFNQPFDIRHGPWIATIVDCNGGAIAASRTLLKGDDDFHYLIRTLKQCRGNQNFRQPPSICVYHVSSSSGLPILSSSYLFPTSTKDTHAEQTPRPQSKMAGIRAAEAKARKAEEERYTQNPALRGTRAPTEEDFNQLIKTGIRGDGFMGCPADREPVPLLEDLSTLFVEDLEDLRDD
jgi:hypothetical protein